MTTKRVLRHYCDFCRKGRFSKPWAIQHELICIKNPKRACPLCHEAGIDQVPIDQLKKAFEEEDVKGLLNACNGCPACALSTIVQVTANWPAEEKWNQFNYKEQFAKFKSEYERY